MEQLRQKLRKRPTLKNGSALLVQLIRSTLDLIPIIAKTKDYADAVDTGRAMIMQLETDTGYSYYTTISCVVETYTVNVLEEGSRFTCVLLKNLINSTNPV